MSEGYLDAVLAVAQLEDDGKVVAISDEDFIRLHATAVVKEPKLPSIATMAGNITKAVAQDIKQGMPRRSEEEAQKILKEICEPCEFYRASDQRCSKCGCFLATKTAWKSQSCPVGKW